MLIIYMVTLQKKSEVYRIIVSGTSLPPDLAVWLFGRWACGPQ